MCLALKKEMTMNEGFREEFSGVHAFKFFTQNSLDEVKDKVLKSAADLEKMKLEI